MADRPGKFICPITGQEICTDRCPLNVQAAKDAKADRHGCHQDPEQ
jgi:hypothetical protein